MKWLSLILVFAAFGFAALTAPTTVNDIDAPGYGRPSQPAMPDRVLISPIGDIRAILGPQGKSIAVSASGTDVAVIYGDPTPDPDNYMEIKIAYSTDGGGTWTTYGPFSGETRRIYPGVDGSPSFDVNPGELYFTWQDSPSGYETGDQLVMIEEGTPSASSPSTPLSLPAASDIYPWIVSIAISPDDPMNVIATGWSYLNYGNNWAYCWVSTDGGYTWSDTIPMCYIDTDGCSGHISMGSGGYVVYTYQDLWNWNGLDIIYPYYLESTDGGYTWSAETPLPEVPLMQADVQFWWHELDGTVYNGDLWFIHNDINQVFADSADMWVFHGTGSPGSWTWDITQVGNYDLDPGITIDDTTWAYAISQYPSISVDPFSGRVLASAKANWLVTTNGVTDTIGSGAHIGGIFTDDNGATWRQARPMSTLHVEEIVWGDWSATETAKWIPNNAVYTAWGDETALNLYFEGGMVEPIGVAEVKDDVASLHFKLAPTIVTDNNCTIMFTMAHAGEVSVNLYDATGRLIENVVTGRLEAGEHDYTFSTSELANGAYFVTLETPSSTVSEKLIQLY